MIKRNDGKELLIKEQFYAVKKNDINKALIDLGEEYFDEEVDTDRASLTGYIIDMFSHISENMSVKENLREDENYIASARLRKSIDKLAVPYNYQYKTAKPSRTVIEIRMSLLPNDEFDFSTNYLIIPALTKIYYLGKQFLLPGDIKLVINPKNNDISVGLMNNSNDDKLPVGDLPSRVISTGFNDSKELIFTTTISQLNKRILQEIVVDRSRLIYYKFRIPSTGMIVSFKLFMYDILNNKIELKQIQNSFKSNNFEDEFVFIIEEFEDEYIIWLDNDSKNKFIKNGTKLKIEITETEGFIGNVKDGEVIIDIPQDIVPRTIRAVKSVELIEGESELGLEEYRSSLISHIQTPDYKNPITIFDYENILHKQLGNISDIKLVVRTLDSAGLQSDIFILLRTENNENVLSNTLNYNIGNPYAKSKMKHGELLINIDDFLILDRNFSSIEIIKSKSSNFQLNGLNYTYNKNNNIINNNITNFDINDDLKLFKSPIVYKFLRAPNRINSFVPNIMSKYQSIKRIDVDVKTKDIIPVALKITSKFIYDKIKQRTILEFNFEAIVNATNDKFFEENTSLYRIELQFDDNHILELLLDAKAKIGTGSLQVYLKDEDPDDVVNIIFPNNLIEIETPITVPIKIIATGPSGHQNNSEYIISEELTFYKNTTDIFNNVLIKEKDTLNVIMKNIPMINFQEFFDYGTNTPKADSYNNSIRFFNQIENLNKLMQNITSAPNINNIKFYNTSGFNAPFNDLTVNTDPKFMAVIGFHYKRYTEFILDKIKNEIVSYVNTTQLEVTLDKSIYLSRLTQLIENKFQSIRYMNIKEPTGNLFYKEERNDVRLLSKEDMTNFSPAKLNLRKENIHLIIEQN